MTTWAKQDKLWLPERFLGPDRENQRHARNILALEAWAERVLTQPHTHDDAAEVTKPHAVIGPFGNRDSVGASATALQLGLPVAEAGNVAGAVDARLMPWVADRPGSIVGIAVALSAARSGGTLSCEVYKNGVATGLIVTINAANTQYHFATQAFGTDTFAAGDRLDVRETTDASWAPTANNLLAWITVAYD